MTEDEMVEWHYWLDEHEFEQAPRVGDGQESLACCCLWGRRIGHDWATELNWYICTELEYEFNSKYNFQWYTLLSFYALIIIISYSCGFFSIHQF